MTGPVWGRNYHETAELDQHLTNSPRWGLAEPTAEGESAHMSAPPILEVISILLVTEARVPTSLTNSGSNPRNELKGSQVTTVGADGDATASESYRPTVNPTREDPGDLTTDEENTTALEATNASSVTITSGGSSIIS